MGNKKFMAAIITSAFLISIMNAGLAVAWTYPRAPNMAPALVDFAFDELSNSDTVNLGFSFSVTQPEWYKDNGSDVILTEVFYQLDYNGSVVLSTASDSLATRYDAVHNFSAHITATPNESHTLLLYIGLLSGYDIFSPGDPHGHFANTVSWNATRIVNFTVDTKGAVATLNYIMQTNSSDPSSQPSPSSSSLTPVPIHGAATSPTANTPTPSPVSTVAPTPTPTRTASPSSSPTSLSPSPSVPEFSSWMVLPLAAVIALGSVLAAKKERTKPKN
jgi:hypothetical protein